MDDMFGPLRACVRHNYIIKEQQSMTDERMNTEDTNATVEANDTPEAQTVKADELQARIEQLEKEAAEYKDQWLRAAADYKNFKRRTDQERAELIRSASAGLL